MGTEHTAAGQAHRTRIAQYAGLSLLGRGVHVHVHVRVHVHMHVHVQHSTSPLTGPSHGLTL